MIFELGPYILEIDVEKTKSFYADAPKITAGCNCQGCRNYEQWAASLSGEPKSTLARMGVQMEKSPEIYVNCPNEDGTLFYGGFYHLCGRIIRDPGLWIPVSEKTVAMNEDAMTDLGCGFLAGFSDRIGLLEANFPTPVIQMELSANIPWILPENCAY